MRLEHGASDGARTRDNRNHNPGLYQLSYARHNNFYLKHATCAPDRIRTCHPRLRRPMLYPNELRAHSRLNDKAKHLLCFIFVRGRGIRTPDILLPKQARYQTALYPVDFAQTNRAAIILSELTYVKHFYRLTVILSSSANRTESCGRIFARISLAMKFAPPQNVS